MLRASERQNIIFKRYTYVSNEYGYNIKDSMEYTMYIQKMSEQIIVAI